nr:RNA methyltransferase [Nocardioides humilatus]
MSRRSVRTERRLFLADGPKAVEGALEAPDRVVEVFATPAGAEQYAGLLAAVDVTLVDERALASLSEAVSPAGVVAVCRMFDQAFDDLADANGPIVICDEIRDPGNAGTILRTADAAGAHGVIFTSDSVDPYNPKAVRASVGSLFHVPFAVDPDPAATVRGLQEAGWVVLAADGGGELDLFTADDVLRQRVAWLFGNEARGLPDELLELADHRVRIPIYGRAESLNLATAAALCLYASAKVHRK